MDKRTIFFVISLSLALLGVNLFFEKQNQESLKTAHTLQEVKKNQQREALEEQINTRTEKPENLPLAKVYADQKGANFLTTALQLNDILVVLPWDASLPKTVYVKGSPFHLTHPAGTDNGPAIYSSKESPVLPVGHLPHLGNYELQLVTPFPKEDNQQPLVTLGSFVDGHFSIPQIELLALDKEHQKADSVLELQRLALSFVLLKEKNHYYPVATYDPKTKSLLLIEQISDLPKTLMVDEHPMESQKQKEEFFVLENETLQLVFSNVGGALAEINLPFESKSENSQSVVKEIEFDRLMIENHPYNAHFPSHAYYTAGKTSQESPILHSQGKLGGYHPLIRRDLIQLPHQNSKRILPEFYAMNIVSEFPELAQMRYKVTHFDQKSITFEASQRNRKIIKTFTLYEGEEKAPYCFDVKINVEGDGRGLWLTSGVPEVEMISNAPAPTIKYRLTRKGKPEVLVVELPASSTTVSDIPIDWICNSNGFFGLIVDPLSNTGTGYKVERVSGTEAPSCLIELDSIKRSYGAHELPGYMTLLPLNPKGGTMKIRVYAGPFATKILKAVDNRFSDPNTEYNPDYIASQSFHGWFSFISAPFAKFLLILMNLFHSVTHSWALSIILLTIALRLMLYPLNAWSTKSMLKMQKIAPEIQKLQERYKKEPQKAQLEIVKLYRENGVNPLSGCLPLLIQMPFLIGMFDLLKSTFELRGASFIPGWINNLAAPDVLFSWSTPIFFIGTEFHLLPFLLGGVMFLQQKISSTLPKNTGPLTEQQRQQKMMGTVMTVVFTVMFYNFPSGLNIYWLSSMLLGILQQWWTQKRFTKKAS